MDGTNFASFMQWRRPGVFTHAGQMLTLSQSAVSRPGQCAGRGDRQTPLFQRHARGLTLTDEGELLLRARFPTC